LLFENYGQKVGGTNTLLVPNLKVGGPVSPGPHRCWAYDCNGVSDKVITNRLLQKNKSSAAENTATQKVIKWLKWL